MNTMRLFIRYIRQHLRLYAVGVLFCAIFLATFLLYHLPLQAVAYPFLLCAAAGVILTLVDFRRVQRRHESLMRIKTITDAIESTLPRPQGIADADYQEIIRIIGEEYSRYCTEANHKYSDMVDYYTVWVHQIKTPIASMALSLQNEDSALSRKLYADLHRIEQYVEMVLTFLRLNADSTDYVIREYDLDGIIKQAVRRLSCDFIGRKLSLVYHPVNASVITDEKWLTFVIEQVLSNALKYTHAGSITITLDAEKRLSIRDTGIGIAPEDLPRIFEKGYTGFNGRTDKKASGIGLYLCKRICTELGHAITAESVVDEGTVITIDLAQRKLEAE